MTKRLLTFFIVLIPTWLQAKMLEVPENCFTEKKAPCLIQSRDEDDVILIGKNELRARVGAIMNWASFEQGQLSLVKGRLHLEKIMDPIRINDIVFSQGSWFVERDKATIYSLDLKSFIFSTYNVFDISSQNVLAHSTFLEKDPFLQFASGFYESKSQFKIFLKSIEIAWKKELQNHTHQQSKVLSRSVAMEEAAERERKLQEERQRLELKKVREEFFYRTFYR